MPEPTLTPEIITARLRRQALDAVQADAAADAIEEAARCQFDPRRLSLRTLSEFRTLLPTLRLDACAQPAAWEVGLDYWDPQSPMTRLCTGHLLNLPPQPGGGLYRIRRIRFNAA